MKRIFRKIQKWRDESFRRRIDRVYFHSEDGKMKVLDGNLYVAGHLFAKGTIGAHMESKEFSDQEVAALLGQQLDRSVQPDS